MIEYNNDGLGDNTNILAMLALQNEPKFSNGTTTASGLYRELIVNVGSDVNQVELNMDTTKALQQQMQNRRDSVSGVNIDEETINLMKFQQIYQANARVISFARDMFTMIFDAVG